MKEHNGISLSLLESFFVLSSPVGGGVELLYTLPLKHFYLILLCKTLSRLKQKTF